MVPKLGKIFNSCSQTHSVPTAGFYCHPYCAVHIGHAGYGCV